MKSTIETSKWFYVALLVAGLFGADLRAAVTFAVSPSTISNTYAGGITLDIAGLSAGQSVVVQKFIDGNTNNAIDDADWLAQQFSLTDGQASVIGGVTNLNIPGDIAAASGTIRAQLSVQMGGVAQRFVGSFAFRLSSPTSQFEPLTNFFKITNSAFAQSFTGTVTSSGTNVPNATVLIFPGSMANSSPSVGVVANNSGSYTLKAAPGTYALLPFKPGLVTDAAASPTLTLNPGGSVNANLTLLPPTRTISGRFVDAANSSVGLPGVLVLCQSKDNRLAIGFTDSNGSFTVPVTAGLWGVSCDDGALPTLGYVGYEDSATSVDTTTGSVAAVNISFPKGTALIYGSVKDELNRPFPGVSLWASDDIYLFSGSGITDQNGNYVAAVTAGTWYIGADSGSPVLANYIVTQGDWFTLADGQAVRKDFTVMPATNHISGYVVDGGNLSPVSGVGVYCHAYLNGTYYHQYTTTGPDGSYILNVTNGNWTVGLSCGGGGGDSLDSLGYQCVPEQALTIANNNGTINFTVQPIVNPQPTLALPSKPSANQFQFQINGVAGQNYTIQASTNLSNWGDVRVTNAPSDSFTVRLNGATNSRTFYRVLVGP
jgi:hypothetical protein